MLTTIGLLALAGAGANAIVIPSTLSFEPSGGHLIDPYAQLLQVPCLGCMYAQPHDDGYDYGHIKRFAYPHVTGGRAAQVCSKQDGAEDSSSWDQVHDRAGEFQDADGTREA